MSLRLLIIVTVVFATVAFAQVDTPYQIRYASNLQFGDSVVNISNTGAQGAGLNSGTLASVTGALCASAYTFSPDEQMISCCSCPVTPNGLVSLSAKNDLISNTLTPAVPTSIVIKLYASVPKSDGCATSAQNPGAPAAGMVASGTTIHLNSSNGSYAVTETPFSPATLSRGVEAAGVYTGGVGSELFRLTQLCNFIVANGSKYGICGSCRFGGLGAGKM